MGLNYRELGRMVRSKDGAQRLTRFVTEALEAKELKPEEFSLRSLFCAVAVDGSGHACGNELLQECFDPAGPRNSLVALESAGAVNTGAFAQIQGQLLFSSFMKGYMDEAFVFTQAVRTIPTSLDGEMVPGITRLGDKAEVVDESAPYPKIGISQDWLRIPKAKKRGMIVPVTKEAVFYDRTGMVLQHAQEGGFSMGLNKEKRIINAFIDENDTTFRYNLRDNVIASYGDNSGTHNWDNLAASNALEDWTDVEAAELLLAAITDPWTGEPIMLSAGDLVVTPDKLWTARRIVNATEIRFGDGASATTQTVGANPVPPLRIISSRLLKAQMATDTTWYYGSVADTVAYYEHWPITPSQAPTGHADEFERDIVYQYKHSEKGTPAVIEPRATIKCTA